MFLYCTRPGGHHDELARREKFLCPIVDREPLMRFLSETSVYKFLQRSEDGLNLALVIWFIEEGLHMRLITHNMSALNSDF